MNTLQQTNKKRPEHSLRMSGIGNPMYGKKLSQEAIAKRNESRKKSGWFKDLELTKAKLSIAGKERKHTEETKQKISKGNTGKVRTKEMRQNLSIKHTGKILTEEHKSKIGLKKEKHPNWQGGKTYTTRMFRKSGDYIRWRKEVLKRDKEICQICGDIGKEVDHIKSFSKYPELRIEVSNGRALCNSCHRKTDTYGVKNG